MTKPIMVIIDEAKWCTGSLSNERGERCAMGYVAEHMGMTLENSSRLPADGITNYELMRLFGGGIGSLRANVQSVNDGLRGDARKLELARLFREQGMVLCFVDSSKAQAVEEPVFRKTYECTWVNA
ncbi:MAG: hypothetical protein IPK60_22790 [Sandaracinaceae bacterium]|nr:hypothetical protein [Sandaracinaceae bacterium]